MPHLNDFYERLSGAYLFPEIARRVALFLRDEPAAAHRLIKCGIGDVSQPLPPAVIEAMHAAVDEMAVKDTFRGYGPPTGYPFLRETIAEHEFAARGLHVDADEIFISDGSKTDCGAILDVFRTGIDPDTGKPFNRIGIADPVYPVYLDTNVMVGNTGERLTGSHAGQFEHLTMLACTPENDFVPSPPDGALDFVYLCYPNNPTGGMITRPQLEAWVAWALKYDAFILYDVAYADYIREPELPRSIYEIDGARSCAIEMHSFSKVGGFTGVRCGFTVCPRDLQGRFADGRPAPVHAMWTRRWGTKANSVGYVVQRAAEALYSLAGRTQVNELIDGYLANARTLRDACRELGMRTWGGDNAPYVWVECPNGESSWETFDRFLRDMQIVITPGVGFGGGGEGFFRISAFTTPANVEAVVERLRVSASG